MNELAQQLKEAGFPQGETEIGAVIDDEMREVVSKDTHSLLPTTDEVIKECGEGFRTLILHTQHRKKLAEPYEAVPNKRLRPECKSKKGNTALVAMMRLYLELNK